MVFTLCRLFGALPSQVLAEDASVLRMLRILDLAGELRGDGEGGEPWPT